jgi:hypothetical protein
MEFTIVGVPAANDLRGTMDRTAVAPANTAVRRMKVRRWIGIPAIFLFGEFMFVISLAVRSASRQCLTGRRFEWNGDTIEFANETQPFFLWCPI